MVEMNLSNNTRRPYMMTFGTIPAPDRNDAFGTLLATHLSGTELTPEALHTCWTDFGPDQAKSCFDKLLRSTKLKGINFFDAETIAIAQYNGLTRCGDNTTIKDNTDDALEAIYACQCKNLKNALPVLDLLSLGFDDSKSVSRATDFVSKALSSRHTVGLQETVKKFCFKPFKITLQKK